LTVPLREQIISGVHPKCWEEMFGNARVSLSDDENIGEEW